MILDFFFVFFIAGYVVGYFTGDLTDNGFELKRRAGADRVCAIAAYFVIFTRFLEERSGAPAGRGRRAGAYDGSRGQLSLHDAGARSPRV